jgi:hypothetical protein
VIPIGGWELMGLLSALLTLSGVWLQWRSQSHVSDIEEAIKNGKISAEAGRRRMRRVEWRATAMIFGGLGLLVFAVFAVLL